MIAKLSAFRLTRLGLGLLAAIALPAAIALASQPNFAPWQNIDLYTGTAIRGGRMLPLQASGPDWEGLPKSGAVLLFAADNGGVLRSLNLGRTWETTNGGRGFGNSFCGGYTSQDGMTQTYTTAAGPAEVCPVGGSGNATEYPLLYGGPPAMTALFGVDSNASDFATSPMPPNALTGVGTVGVSPKGSPGMAEGIVYRASNHLYASPDAAASWFPVSPQCEVNSPYPMVHAIAVDRARPGHVVVGARNPAATAPISHKNLSGCAAVDDAAAANSANFHMCGLSSIATTDSIGRDLAAVFIATANPSASRTALKNVELAAGGGADAVTADLPTGPDKDAAIAEWALRDKWRYGTVAHLPTGAQCSIGQKGNSATEANASSWTCKRASTICHGRKPEDYTTAGSDLPADPLAWCPNTVHCACKSSDLCHYPQIRHLEIDPRNGYAYAVTNSIQGPVSVEFGLLTSPDGGRHWMRMGNASSTASENDSALPPAIAASTRGAQVLTHQFEPAPANGDPRTDENAFDLTRHPLQVKWMGRMSMAWTPCATAQYSQNGVPMLDYHNDPRPRGTLVASLPVEWLSSTGHRVSSVFVAIEKDDCQGEKELPGALIFRDTANLVQAPGAPAMLGDAGPNGQTFQWVAREAVPASVRKLPRQAALAAQPIVFHYGGGVVAQADNRVLYAWSYGRTGLLSVPMANDPTAGSLPTKDPPKGSLLATGLWRSRDRGLTWALVTTVDSPDFTPIHTTYPGELTTVDLTVDPQDPRRVMVAGTFFEQGASGSQSALLLGPTDETLAAGEVPKPDCSECPVAGSCGAMKERCPGIPAAISCNFSYCDHSKVAPDFCSLFNMDLNNNYACHASEKGSTGNSYIHCPSGGLASIAFHSTCATVLPGDEAMVATGAQVKLHPIRETCVPCAPSSPSTDASTGLPLPCCLKWRSLNSEPDKTSGAAGVPDLGVSDLPNDLPKTCVTMPARARGLGGSGASGLTATILPAPAPGQTAATQSLVMVGTDDTSSDLTAAPSTTAPGNLVGQAAGLRLTDGRAIVASHAVGDYLFWVNNVGLGATFAQKCNNFLMLTRLTNAPAKFAGLETAAELEAIGPIISPDDPRLVDPNSQKRTYFSPRIAEVASYRGLAKTRLTDSGHGLLIFSSPGVGVLAVPVLTPKLPEEATLHRAGWAKPIAFQPPTGQQDPIPLGVCAADAVMVGDTLWVAVPVSHPTSVTNGLDYKCRDLDPGLYRTTLPQWVFEASPAAADRWHWKGAAPVLTRVPGSEVFDPHSLAAIPVPQFQGANGDLALIVGDFAKPAAVNGNACSGGLWACEPPAAGQPLVNCRLNVVTDGIVDMDVGKIPSQSKWYGGSDAVWFNVNPRIYQDGMVFNENGTGPGFVSSYWTSVKGRPAERQGVHVMSVGAGLLATSALPDLQQLAACSPISVGATLDCNTLGTTACLSLTSTPPGERGTGVGRAVAHFSAVAVDHGGSGTTVVTSNGGQGNYILPGSVLGNLKPGQGIPGQVGTDGTLIGDGDWAGPGPGVPNVPGTVIVAPPLTPTTTPLWRLSGVQLSWRCGGAFSDEACGQVPIPTWLTAAYGTPRYSSEWQSARLPASRWRQGFDPAQVLPGEFVLMAANEGAAPEMAATAVSPLHWQFDLAAGQDGALETAGRLNIRLASPLDLGAGHWRLNGAPLRTAESVPGTQFHASTDQLAASNDLELVCPPQQSCSADVLGVTVALPQSLTGWTDLEQGAQAAESTWLFQPTYLLGQRRAAWLLVEVDDAQLTTVLQFNGGLPRLLTDGRLVTPAGATRGAVYRVPVAGDLANVGPNRAIANVAPCALGSCPVRANVRSMRLVLETSDDPQLCLAGPEKCDTVDNDCDGTTDEAAEPLCDGPDLDGCSLGRSTCDSAVCTETATAQQLLPAPTALQIASANAVAVFADGGELALQPLNQPVDLFQALRSGAYFPDLAGLQSPNGSTIVVRLRVTIATLPTVVWGGLTREVQIRSLPGDDGHTLTMEITGGADVSAGHQVVLVVDNAPEHPPLETIYGCPSGDLTMPSRLAVRNACDFPGVTCGATSGPGSACDSSSPTSLCPSCTGDFDGCRNGFLLPLGSDGGLVCAADSPTPAVSLAPTGLQVAIATATFYFDAGEPVEVSAAAQMQDLFAALESGEATIAGLVVPPAPVAGAQLRAVRLSLAAGTDATAYEPQTGSTPVIPRSTGADTGRDIDLTFVQAGPGLQPGMPLRAIAQAESGPAGWKARYQCPGGESTVLAHLQVLPQCPAPGCGP